MAFAPIAAAVIAGTASGSAPIHLTVASGTPQRAHAWALSNADFYETKFDDALVVHVSPRDLKVRFRCVTRSCTFPPSDQADSTIRVDASAYDVAAENGVASIKIVVRTATTGPITVVAAPANNPHRAAVRFTLMAM